jgi:type IV secretory pathway VirD2 relaxase
MTIINENDILAALKNGEDPEILANYLIDTLNSAIKTFEAEKTAAEKQKKKMELAAQISTLMIRYYDLTVEGFTDEIEITPEFVVDLLDTSAQQCEKTAAEVKQIKKSLENITKEDVDASIDAFLKAFGLN